MLSELEKHVEPEAQRLFKSSLLSINHELITVAAVQAWAHCARRNQVF